MLVHPEQLGDTMSTILTLGFGDRLRNQRKDLKLTQIQFAQLVGVTTLTQHMYEHEDTSPNIKYLESIQKIGVDLDYLLFENKNNPQIESNTLISIKPNLLRDIYSVVDTVSYDENGRLLPLETRQNIFSILCASYAGRMDDNVNMDNVHLMLGH